tara:strand:- start:572 stop:1093 length:522 start_codon:yes stop_codon:yes gene_type:complete
MAERVVDRIAKKMEEEYDTELKECFTEKIFLCGNVDFKKFKHVKKYIDEVYEQIKEDGFTKHDAWFLVTNYGKQTEKILENYKGIVEADKYVRLAKAELAFGIDYEMVQTPMDFFIRRTGRLYFDIDSIRTLMEPLMAEFQNRFKVTDDVVEEWRTTLNAELKEHSDFSLERR